MRFFFSLLAAALVQHCAPAVPLYPRVQVVLQSNDASAQSSGLRPFEGASTGLINDEYCYAIHVSGNHERLKRFPIEPNAEFCPDSPSGYGIASGLYAKGGEAVVTVPEGIAHRFDLIAIAKTDLGTSQQNCTGLLGIDSNTLPDGVEVGEMAIDGDAIDPGKTRLIASAVADIKPGENLVQVTSATADNDPNGLPYLCPAKSTTGEGQTTLAIPVTITQVDSVLVDGSYPATTLIQLAVEFTEPVTVTNFPRLLLETGATDRYAYYSSGSGSPTLVFEYTVAAGETSLDLDYLSMLALELNGGTISDSRGDPANLTLALPGAPGSLGFSSNLVIDTTPPIFAISTPPNETAAASSIGVAGSCEDSLSIDITGSGVASQSNPTCSSSAFSAAITFTSGDGPKAVVFSQSDLAGNTTIETRTFHNDTTGPTSISITIDTGAPFTSSSTVNLDLAPADATDMYVTNTAGCSSDGTWQAASASLAAWPLAQSNATATVYAKFRDALGNESACVNDTIVHDTTAPSPPGGVSHAPTIASTTSTPSILYSAASDALSGIARYEYAIGTGTVGNQLNDIQNWTTAPVSPFSESGFSFGGGLPYFVSLRAVDGAGNTSSIVTSPGWIADASPAPLPVTNGRVNAMARVGHTLYVGGAFTTVGQFNGYGVPVNATATVPLSTLPVNGPVHVAIPDGSGGWYIGGEFTKVGGIAKSYVARINYDGSLDGSFTASTNNFVFSLLLDGSFLYIGGQFTTVNTIARSKFAAVDANTGTLDGRLVGGTGINGAVRAIARNATTIYIGGDFSSVASVTQHKLTSLNPSNFGVWTLANTNSPTFFNNSVHALKIIGTRLYVGGNFLDVDAIATRDYMVALNTANDTIDTGWTGTANGAVNALGSDGATLYVGGNFTSLSGSGRSYIGALDLSTGAATGWNPGASGTVFALDVDAIDVYIGGMFNGAGGSPRRMVAKLNKTSGVVDAWDPGFGSTVKAIAVSGTNVYVGTNSPILSNAQPRSGLAAFDLTTGVVTSWNPGTNNEILAMATCPDGTVLVGGNFATVDSQSRSNLAAIDPAGDATLWNPGANNLVYALACDGTHAYVGGSFTNLGSAARSKLGSVPLASNFATAWDPSANQDVYAIGIAATEIYVGGAFTQFGGTIRNRLGSFDLDNKTLTAFNPNLNGAVKSLAVAGGDIFVGGDFTTVNGATTRNSLASFNITGTALAWNPSASSTVKSIQVDGNAVFVGGSFSTTGGQPRSRIAQLDRTTNTAIAGWNPGNGNTSMPVHNLLVAGKNVYVGGEFTFLGGKNIPHLAVIRPDGTAP